MKIVWQKTLKELEGTRPVNRFGYESRSSIPTRGGRLRIFLYCAFLGFSLPSIAVYSFTQKYSIQTFQAFSEKISLSHPLSIFATLSFSICLVFGFIFAYGSEIKFIRRKPTKRL